MPISFADLDRPVSCGSVEPNRMANPLLPGASVRDIRSKAGRDYRIFIWQPPDVADTPLPVMYLLDGNSTFPITAATAALQSRRPERTNVRPAVIVGIGYPNDQWLDAERRTYDYTPAVPADLLPRRPDRDGWSRTGGADEFLDFVGSELQPLIEREFRIDGDHRALFGHSFGGLFVLYALFTRPDLFRNSIAASPSIWFGRDHLAAASRRFFNGDTMGRRLLITVGGLEQDQPDAGDGAPLDYGSWIKRNRMVDNARALAADLAAVDHNKLEVGFTEFADENHASVLPAAISRALRFALAARN